MITTTTKLTKFKRYLLSHRKIFHEWFLRMFHDDGARVANETIYFKRSRTTLVHYIFSIGVCVAVHKYSV